MRAESHELELGQSVQGRRLVAWELGPQGAAGAPCVLVLGGVHADEVEGIWITEEMRERWSRDFPFKKTSVVLWPVVNPDGVALGTRWNANKVDLNRNLPSKDWSPEIKNPRYPPGPSAASEPETRALVELIASRKPVAILSVHSFSRYQVNANGPSKPWAERLAALCGYPVTEDIGYPTPGCLGTYAGAELLIPTITLEIERGLPREKVLALHGSVLDAAVRFWDEK